MPDGSQAVPQARSAPCRVGLIIADAGKLNRNALKYLILQLNCLQHKIEFEFLPSFDDPFLALLEAPTEISRKKARAEAKKFVGRCSEHFLRLASDYDLPEEGGIPRSFIVVSLASFDDHHYSLSEDRIAVAALGDWERSMAPPSIIETILTLVLRQSVAFVSPTFIRSRHLGTKGCLFDFTAELTDVKFKVLQGFICFDCRKVLENDGHADLAGNLEGILARRWFRRKSIPGSPASIVSKFGYDLFVTKGLQPTLAESILGTLRKDGVKEILKLVSTLLIAALLLWLGLKK